MPVYQYKGLTSGNRKAQGMIDADSLRAARLKLRSQGIFPTALSAGRTGSVLSGSLARLKLPQLRSVPPLDLALFTGQLSTLLSAGSPVVEALAALTEQVENKRLKSVVGSLRDQVNHGSSLADAMGEHAEVFNELYCSLVRAGESAGALELVLTRLAAYLEGQTELRNKITGAMVYPVIMLVASVAVMGVALVWVIPMMAELLQDLDQPLPVLTRVVLAVSGLLTAWWIPITVSGAGAFLLANRAIQTARGRKAWDGLRLRLPVLGRVVRQIAISRFARTLATLVSGGLNIVSALEIAEKVTANRVIGEAIEEARESITRGASIAGPLRQSGQFPPLVLHMVAVGEASGQLPAMLSKVADTYDGMVEHTLDRLIALMSPVMLLLVAGVVVIVIMSTLLPLMNLTAAL